jgi:hypothetical protein
VTCCPQQRCKESRERDRDRLPAIGPKSHNEMNRRQFEMDLIDEQIDTTTQAFLGLTIACARCHDHKFDPIPQKDYYALAGIFRSTETCYGTVRSIQSNHPSPLIQLPAKCGEPAGIAPLSAARREALEKQISDMREQISGTGMDAFINTIGYEFGYRMCKARSTCSRRTARRSCKRWGSERFRYADTALLSRGEVDKPGTLSPRTSRYDDEAAAITGSGRHLAGGSRRSRTLTARVYVNRVWHHLFGQASCRR